VKPTATVLTNAIFTGLRFELEQTSRGLSAIAELLVDIMTYQTEPFPTRWLYGVECPQYSTRLEALGCLCDCVSGRVQQVVKVICHKAHRRRRGMFYVIRQVPATGPPMRAHWSHLATTIELVHPSAH